MRCSQIKKFHHAGRIDPFVSAKACLLRLRRIAQVDKRYRKLLLLELFISKLFERGPRSFIYQRLQRSSRGLLDWLSLSERRGDRDGCKQAESSEQVNDF